MNRLAVFAFAALMAGCASRRAPPELVDARAAYSRARTGPALDVNTAGLRDAHRALEQAERRFDEDPSSEETRHLAYIAHRKALVAEANARAVIASTQGQRAEHTLAALRDKQREAPMDLGEKDSTSSPEAEQKARSRAPRGR